MAAADTSDGAREYLSQVSRIPLEKLDSLSLEHRTNLTRSLEIVRDGGAVPADLQTEVDAINNCPVDEGDGEGYHRQTNLTKVRGAASRSTWVSASTRFKQNLARAKKITTNYGRSGVDVFRYEWKNFKRVLKFRRRRFAPRRMQDKIFYKTLYRLSHSCNDDWGPLVGAEAPQKVEENATDRMRYEYLQRTFKARAYYSTPKPIEGPVEDHVPLGARNPAKATAERDFFQCIAVHTQRAKPKLVPVHDSGTVQ